MLVDDGVVDDGRLVRRVGGVTAGRRCGRSVTDAIQA